MSEAKTKKASKSTGSDASKSKSKSTDTKAADTKAKETKSADATTSSDSSSSGSSGGTEGGKSARESIGGTSGVHYGYFSSVRTPAYRSGWDDIWGKGNGKKRNTRKKAAKPRKKPEPITLTLDLDDLPAKLRNGLVDVARAELKKQSRLSYERREKAGAIDWRITCRIDR